MVSLLDWAVPPIPEGLVPMPTGTANTRGRQTHLDLLSVSNGVPENSCLFRRPRHSIKRGCGGLDGAKAYSQPDAASYLGINGGLDC